MIIPTEEIKKVHKFIFEHGCIVVEDKPTFEEHPMIDVTNHKVMKIVKSMTSKGLLNRRFVWNHAYYTINDAGIAWLRKKLFLENTEYPATHAGLGAVPSKKEEVAAEEAPAFRR